MPGVLAWIVAVERHAAPTGSSRSPLDFTAPVSRRALEWAEWLSGQAGTRLLLNIAAAPDSDEQARLDKLRQGILNGAEAHRADAAALHGALKKVESLPLADVLLVLWIGHGVMRDRQRYLLHQEAQDAGNLRSWEVDSLLQHLRSDKAPALQIGVFDTCAQVLSERPGHEQLGGTGKGKALRRQHFYFAASAAALASVNPFEPTLSSMTLQGLKEIDWPPRPEALDAVLQQRLHILASRPVRFEWTQGSGDQWSSRTAGVDDDAASDAGIAQQARRGKLSEVSFRHLWREVAKVGVTTGQLAAALRKRDVDELAVVKLASRLERRQPGSPEPDLLRDAWARVQRIEPWIPLLSCLGLSLPHWSEIARQVADRDGRTLPEFSELRELLLWTLNMPRGSERADAALLSLMLLALQEAGRLGAAAASPASAQAAKELRDRLKTDPGLSPLMPKVQATTVLPQRPVTLFVELDLPANAKEPAIVQHWLLRSEEIERGSTAALQGRVGEQINALINGIRCGGRSLRVELLAPLLLLSEQGKWLSYAIDPSNPLGAPVPGDLRAKGRLKRVGLDTCWPISWRWKDRLKGKHATLQPGKWRQRAKQVQDLARASTNLQCRFDGQPPEPDLQDAHVRGLSYLPPSPARMQRNALEFFLALIDGDPYMLWPGEEPGDVEAFKTTVRKWLAGQQLSDLPEALYQARKNGLLPEIVLFIDEPDRDPYAQTQDFQTMGPAAS